MKITAETLVSASELAVVMGITARRIRQLVEDGILHKKDGKFVLCSAVQEYMSFTNKGQSKDEKDIEKAKLAAEAKLKESKAVIAELEADELKGKMHRADDVKVLTEDLVYTIRNGLLALPGRVAVDTAAATTAAETREIVRKEALKIMQELANYKYDPAKYEERVRERKDWDAAAEVDDDE